MNKISSHSCHNSLIGSLSHTDYPYYDGHSKSRGATAFTAFVNNEGLKISSESVYKIVAYAEHIFKVYVCKDKLDKISVSSKITQKMIIEVITTSGRIVEKVKDYFRVIHKASMSQYLKKTMSVG